ncbi:MAG: hydroxyacid dehydrogenase, partial [Methyloligellaceae bacterium]
MKRVLVVTSFHPDGMALLKKRSDIEIEVLEDISSDAIRRALPGANAITVRLAKLPSDLLALADDLRVVAKHGVGCDNIAVDYLTSRGIPVAIAAGANSLSVAEHTMMLMLAAAKQALYFDQAARAQDFEARNRVNTMEVAGKTLSIIGFGRIGTKVARLARAFDMRLLVTDIAMNHALAEDLGCEVVADYHDALAEADIVSLHVPLTELTRQMIDAAAFRRMKDTAILINCARGSIVDEKALADALSAGEIAAAGVDVFDQEPPGADHPLFAQPNVIFSPHSA